MVFHEKKKKTAGFTHSWNNWKVKVAQLSPTLCDPVDYTAIGILQARMLDIG